LSDTDLATLIRDLATPADPELVDRLARRVADLVAAERSSSPWMSAPQAAEYLDWPLKRVYNLTSAQSIPHHRQGGRLIFHRDELDAWLNDLYCGPARFAS
jgi:excisionase family DNA binding protein